MLTMDAAKYQYPSRLTVTLKAITTGIGMKHGARVNIKGGIPTHTGGDRTPCIEIHRYVGMYNTYVAIFYSGNISS